MDPMGLNILNFLNDDFPLVKPLPGSMIDTAGLCQITQSH